ncbi:MAG: class I SAM-dependent methyltransferase [Chloroflexi bacterium]|nr:class I SAM-dependent methyltransferase [Chloroflexota bacterium]
MMKDDIVQKLLDLNQRFYNKVALSFDNSRQNPMEGFFDMLDYLPVPQVHLCDVGCGNGRYGHFLRQQERLAGYAGVDFSVELLQKAREMVGMGQFYQRDMSKPAFLDDIGKFDVVACIAAMHHLPGRHNRVQLLRELKEHVAENGRIFLANWQFMDSVRQQRKVLDWSEIGLTDDDVEQGDYLLKWQRGGLALRYACMVDEVETALLAQEANLQIEAQFRNDGKEGNLSLYTIFKPVDTPPTNATIL